MWYYFLGSLGWVMMLFVLGLLIVLVVCWCCGVSVESAAMWSEADATLTCFHCGQETTANRKICEHCNGELQ